MLLVVHDPRSINLNTIENQFESSDGSFDLFALIQENNPLNTSLLDQYSNCLVVVADSAIEDSSTREALLNYSRNTGNLVISSDNYSKLDPKIFDTFSERSIRIAKIEKKILLEGRNEYTGILSNASLQVFEKFTFRRKHKAFRNSPILKNSKDNGLFGYHHFGLRSFDADSGNMLTLFAFDLRQLDGYDIVELLQKELSLLQ